MNKSSNYQRAIDLYATGEFEKALKLLLEVVASEEILKETVEEALLIYRIGDCRRNLYQANKQIELLESAVVDFKKCSAILLENHLKEKIKMNLLKDPKK